MTSDCPADTDEAQAKRIADAKADAIACGVDPAIMNPQSQRSLEASTQEFLAHRKGA